LLLFSLTLNFHEQSLKLSANGRYNFSSVASNTAYILGVQNCLYEKYFILTTKGIKE